MPICRLLQVADFGLSHVMYGRNHYQPEKLYGDLKFMAPEAIFGKVVSPAMDIWSMGMLIFDMMSPEGVAHDIRDAEALLAFLKGPVAVLPDGTPASIQVGLHILLRRIDSCPPHLYLLVVVFAMDGTAELQPIHCFLLLALLPVLTR